jgi:ADP-ribose pyrophosphatase YjhB (NUDIX family)
MRNFIPPKLYAKIQKILPVTCIDLVIRTDNGVLLGIRANEPVKGIRWVVGGRILYGESFEQAVKRKAMTETGLKVQIIREVGAYANIFTKGEVRHSINIVYLVKAVGGKIRMNDEYSGYVILKRPDKKLHPYVLTLLNDSKAFKNEKVVTKKMNKKVWLN